MKVRLRAWDLLVVLGLVTLTAWTPAYFAQDVAERALLDGESFHLPVPRYGDRLDLRLVVRDVDGAVQASEPVMRVMFERPGPGDPNGAALVELREWDRAHVRLGPGLLEQERAWHRTVYDADLVPLWSASEKLGHGRGLYRYETGPDRYRFETAGPAGLPLWPYHDLPLHYDRADPLRSFFMEAREQHEDGTASVTAERNDREQSRLQAVYGSDHGLLYAGAVRSFHFERPVEFKELYLGIHTYDVRLALDPLVPGVGGWKAWSWYMQDFPIQVGEHYEIHDMDGTLLMTADLVPFRMERGDAPIGPATTTSTVGNPTDLQIRSWKEDAGMLAGAVSARTIHAWLTSDDAAADIRGFMENGGHLAGIAWNGSFDRDGGALSEIRWLTLLVADDGTTQVATFWTSVDGQLDLAHGIRSVCGEQQPFGQQRFSIACSRVDLQKTERHNGDPIASLDRSTLPPSALASLLHEEAFRDIDAGTMFNVTVGLVPPFGEERHMDTRDVKGHIFYTPMGTQAPASTEVWSDQAERRIYLGFEDGRLRLASRVDRDVPASAFAAALAPQSGTPIAPIVRVDVLGPEAAYVGVALIALGLLARAVAAVKVGAHVPFFALLYAKIHKDAALDHARRAHLAALIEARPGLSLSDVAKELHIHRTVAYHHLETLQRNGILRRVRVGRALHYVPRPLAGAEAMHAVVKARPEWARVFEAIRAEPGLSGTEIADRIGRHKSRVTRIGGRLETLGVVRSHRASGMRRYFPQHP